MSLECPAPIGGKPNTLTAAAVQEAVLSALTKSSDNNDTLAAQPCHRLAEGCHHTVWSVGPYILHALPASVKNARSLKRDAAVATLLRRYSTAPHTISVPSKMFRIDGWVCTLQERLPGISLEHSPRARSRNKTTEDCVQLLKMLRSVPRDEAMDATGYECEAPNLQKRIAKALRHWEELRNIGYVTVSGETIKDALSLESLRKLEPAPYRPVLLHGDLSMQHILVDEADGTITGVIDWSDAMLGDPCEDIAGVALSLGAGTARVVAARAGFDEYTAVRGLLFAKCLAIADLRELKCGVEKQPPEQLLRAQFRMAFEDMDPRVESFFQ